MGDQFCHLKAMCTGWEEVPANGNGNGNGSREFDEAA